MTLNNELYYPFDSKRPVDLMTVGRVAVDLYGEQIGSSLVDTQSFRKYLGGCPGNISVGTARLGLKSTILSRVGDDDMGGYLKKTLTKEGVDISHLQTDSERLTALVLLGVNPPDNFPLIFYRENCADNHIDIAEFDASALKDIKALLISGTSFAHPSLKAGINQLIKAAKEAGAALIFDIDYRPVLWGLTKPGDGESRFEPSQEVTDELLNVISNFDLIVGTEEEFSIASGKSDNDASIATIREKAPNSLLVLKTGEKGCSVYLPDQQEAYVSTPFPVEVMNVLGAGDAFFSGFLKGWLEKESIETCTQYANANGALVVTRHGCSPAMASFEELSYFINNYSTIHEANHAAQLERLHQQLEMPRVTHSKDLCILAFDHRTQFEEICDRGKIPREKITQYKNLVFKAFEEVNAEQADDNLAVIVDPIYGKDIIHQCAKKDIQLGMPIEKASSHPTSWISEGSLYDEILHRSSETLIKFLWKYHPDLEANIKRHQLDKLKELQDVCTKLSRPLMLELIIPSPFEENGESLAYAMESVYQEGVYPAWWKIAAVDTQQEWDMLVEVMDRYDSHAQVIILGKNASIDQFSNWFSIAQSTDHSVGFAIGRTIFWEPWLQYSQGEKTDQELIQELKRRYVTLIKDWKTAAVLQTA